MRYNKKDMSTECRCGLSVKNLMHQVNRTMSGAYHTEKAFERELLNLKNSVEKMGITCNIDVDEPIKYINRYYGNMDVIGYREEPLEGLNYWEMDIQEFFEIINDTIESSLSKCDMRKTPFKQYK